MNQIILNFRLMIMIICLFISPHILYGSQSEDDSFDFDYDYLSIPDDSQGAEEWLRYLDAEFAIHSDSKRSCVTGEVSQGIQAVLRDMNDLREGFRLLGGQSNGFDDFIKDHVSSDYVSHVNVNLIEDSVAEVARRLIFEEVARRFCALIEDAIDDNNTIDDTLLEDNIYQYAISHKDTITYPLFHDSAALSYDSNETLNRNKIAKQSYLSQYKDIHGDTLVCKAIKKDNCSILKLLFELGIDKNQTDSDNRTLLHFATQHRADKAIRFLLDAGLTPYAIGNIDKMTPLHNVILYIKWGLFGFSDAWGLKQRVKTFLDAGIDINELDAEGNTFLIKALNHCQYDSVRVLLELGADPNKASSKGVRPLHVAAHFYSNYSDLRVKLGLRKDTIQLLVDAGAEVNPPAKAGNSPLYIAARQRQNLNIISLLNAGANVNYVSWKTGKTPLIAAVEPHEFWHDDNQHAVVKLLLDAGADRRIVDSDGKAAMDYATKPDIQKLLEYPGNQA